MIAYLLLMSLPLLFGLTQPRRAPDAALILVAILYWLFIGLRFQTGTDWFGYMNQLRVVKYLDLPKIWQQAEPGFWTLLWINDRTGWGLTGINIMSATVFLIGLFAFARKTASPWIAVAVATSYLVLTLGMGGIRQAMAMGLIFIVLADWNKRSTASKLLFIGAASLFHFSAVFMAAFLAFGKGSSRRLQVLGIFGAGLVVILLARSQPEQVDVYMQRYVGEGSVVAQGAIFHALLNALPAGVYLLFRKRWREYFGPNPLLIALSLAALAMLPLVFVSSIAASRLSMYLTVAPMMIWASAPLVFGGQKSQAQLAAGVLAVQAGVMVVWLAFANVAPAFFPYRNVLLGAG